MKYILPKKKSICSSKSIKHLLFERFKSNKHFHEIHSLVFMHSLSFAFWTYYMISRMYKKWCSKKGDKKKLHEKLCLSHVGLFSFFSTLSISVFLSCYPFFPFTWMINGNVILFFLSFFQPCKTIRVILNCVPLLDSCLIEECVVNGGKGWRNITDCGFLSTTIRTEPNWSSSTHFTFTQLILLKNT